MLAVTALAVASNPANETFDAADGDGYTPPGTQPFTVPPPFGTAPAFWVGQGEYRSSPTSGLVEEVPSGTHGIASANGSAGHAEFYPAYNGGFDTFHRNGGGADGVPFTGPYSFKMDIYIDPSWMPRCPAGGCGAEDDFWINQGVNDNLPGPPNGNYLSEGSLRFNVTDVNTDTIKEYRFHTGPGNGIGSLFTTTTPGWYTLEQVVDVGPDGPDANGDPDVLFTHRIWNIQRTVVLSSANTFPSFNSANGAMLGGDRYSSFFFVHTNITPFVAIDNVSVGPPLPLNPVSLVASDTCVNANPVTVEVRMPLSQHLVVGGQFFLEYDETILDFVSMSPGGAPFTDEIYESVNELAGTIDYAVGVSGGGPGTMGPSTLATITFNRVGPQVCNSSNLVTFRTHTPPTRLTNILGDPINPELSNLGPMTIDTTAPVVSCPSSPVVVACGQASDPYATGTATATDTCDTSPAITYDDDRSGLTGCNATGNIIRTWTATDCSGNSTSCNQTITLVDLTAPAMTACPANIGPLNADAGGCTAVVTYTAPTAVDQCYSQGFEDPAFVSGQVSTQPSVDWNDYESRLTRVPSGTDGITSKSGAAHGSIDSTGFAPPPQSSPFTGAFTRLRGYSSVFGTGFTTSLDVYINLSDPKVANNTYGFDLSTAANNQANAHRRDFIFHAAADASDAVNTVLVAGSNNSNFAPRQDLDTIANHYVINSSGWYTFEWVFRDNAGVLAVDMILRDALGTQLFIETRSDPSDLISTVVGGSRYMWFTVIEADKLAIDNTQLIRNVPVFCSLPSGSAFPAIANTVTCTATDACSNSSQCQFTIDVEPFNTMMVDVQLDGSFSTSFTRCVTFELFDCPGGTPTVVNWDVNFVNGAANDVPVDVPCGFYDCVTARDRKHTLRRTDSGFALVGTQYDAEFVASSSDALVGGNLNDDFFIDILDFGIFVGQWNATPGASTPCGYAGFHADISGDGVVSSGDFTFIQINFLDEHELNCCSLPNDGGDRRAGPITSISVRDLQRLGLPELIRADLNRDGWLDQQDIAVFMQNGGQP